MNAAMLEAIVPIAAMLTFFGMPVAIVFINKYFKLKHRELDVEAELQKKFTEEHRRQMEARLAGLENAMQAVLQIVAPRVPPASQTEAQQLSAVAEPPPLGAVEPSPAPGQRERG